MVARLLLISGDDEPITWRDVAASLAFTAVALVVALGAVLPRVERATPAVAGSAALGLAILALATLPMFWFSGAPFALAATAVALAHAAAPRGGRRTAALAIGCLVALLSLALTLAITVSQFDPTLPA